MEIKSNIINKPRQLITIDGKMGVRERVVYNTLLQLIEEDKRDNEGYFITNIAHISSMTNIKDYKDLENILLNLLPYTKLRIDILNKDEEKRRVIQLIGEIEIFNKNEVKLFFTPTIIKMVKNRNYTKLEMDVLSKLNSKYSLTMYEIIKRYYVSNTSYYTIPDMKLEDFRSLMGIDENQYKRVADFKRYVFNQIIKDINEKTDFNIEYELYKKNSRSFNYVRFNFSKKEVKDEIKDEAKAEELEIKNYNDDKRFKELEKELEIMRNKLELSERINSEFKNNDIVDEDLSEEIEEEKNNIGLPF